MKVSGKLFRIIALSLFVALILLNTTRFLSLLKDVFWTTKNIIAIKEVKMFFVIFLALFLLFFTILSVKK